MPEVKLNLDTLQGGAARELFEIELQKVLRNIADPNTKPDAVRKLTLEVTIKPNEKRSMLYVAVKASSKLVAMRPSESMAVLDEDGNGNGNFVATELIAGQMPGQIEIEEVQASAQPADAEPKEEARKTSNVRPIQAAGKAR